MSTEAIYVIRQHEGIHRLEGPFSKAQVMNALKSGDLSWGDLLLTADAPSILRRFYEIAEFWSALPPAPSKAVLKTYTERITGKKTETKTQFVEEEEWRIQFNGSEFGPFTPSKIISLVSKQKALTGDTYVWRSGMENWAHAPTIEELMKIFSEFYQRKKEAKGPAFELSNYREQRGSPRVKIIATVVEISTRRGRRAIGTCSNLSGTGIAVTLNPSVPLQKGQQLTIEVAPVSISEIRPFRAAAIVKWANRTKAGLQFVGISKETENILKQHLTSKFWRGK